MDELFKKLAELVDFPPSEGGDENWMFPYDIAQTFFQSPRNRRRQSAVDWKELENQFSESGGLSDIFHHLTDKHYANQPTGQGALMWTPNINPNLSHESYLRAHHVMHLNQEESHEHPDWEPTYEPLHQRQMNQLDVLYGMGGISDSDAYDRLSQIRGKAKNSQVHPEAAWAHLVMHHGLPANMLPVDGHGHNDYDHAAMIANPSQAFDHLTRHHNRDISDDIDSGSLVDLALAHDTKLHNPHFLHDKHHDTASKMLWVPHHHEAKDKLMAPGYDGTLSIPGKEQVDSYGFPAMR